MQSRSCDSSLHKYRYPDIFITDLDTFIQLWPHKYNLGLGVLDRPRMYSAARGAWWYEQILLAAPLVPGITLFIWCTALLRCLGFRCQLQQQHGRRFSAAQQHNTTTALGNYKLHNNHAHHSASADPGRCSVDIIYCRY